MYAGTHSMSDHASAPQRDATRLRLLLVEDDPALTDLLQWHFGREDFDVVHTGNGEEALALAAEVPPDIILLDWMIEGVSGLEVCRQLRRAPATAAVPVIMLTGRTEEADRVRGLENGADDYVTKPFSPRELIARVRAVLRRARPAPNQQLRLADLEMDLIQHKVRRAAQHRARPDRVSPASPFPRKSRPLFSRERCSTRSGAVTRISTAHRRRAIRRSAKRSTSTGRPELIRTVRSAAMRSTRRR